jgi:hypothetical protein
MTYPDIIEAAAQAIYDFDSYPMPWSSETETRRRDYRELAATVVAAVAPLIEDAYAKKLDAAEEIARKGNEYVKGWKLLEDDGSVTTLGAVAPLIRAAALEEAALRIEADEEDYLMRMYAAEAIRTLKDKP